MISLLFQAPNAIIGPCGTEVKVLEPCVVRLNEGRAEAASPGSLPPLYPTRRIQTGEGLCWCTQEDPLEDLDYVPAVARGQGVSGRRASAEIKVAAG